MSRGSGAAVPCTPAHGMASRDDLTGIEAKIQKSGLLYKLPFKNQLEKPRGTWKV